LGDSTASSSYHLLCLLLEQWPQSVPFEPASEAELFFLLKSAGLGLVKKDTTVPRAAKTRTAHTMPSVDDYGKGVVQDTPLLRAFKTLLRSQLLRGVDLGLDTHSNGVPRSFPLTSSPSLAMSMLGVLDKTMTLALFKHHTVLPDDAADLSMVSAGADAGADNKNLSKGAKKADSGVFPKSGTKKKRLSGQECTDGAGIGGSSSSGQPSLGEARASYFPASVAFATLSPEGAGIEGLPPRPEVVLESKHEYEIGSSEGFPLSLPHSHEGMEIVFDPRCSTENSYDWVAVYADSSRQRLLGGKYSGRRGSLDKNWAGVGTLRERKRELRLGLAAHVLPFTVR
jgi:hypothetical protein